MRSLLFLIKFSYFHQTRLFDHKLGIFVIFWELFLTVVVLMSTFKNKNSLRTIEAKFHKKN